MLGLCLNNMYDVILVCSQSHLVETAVYDLVDQLQSGLAEEDRKNLTPEEGCV